MKKLSILLITLIFATSCNQNSMQKLDIPTPKVAKKTKVFELHGDKRTDDYYWLNERENPEVISYLEAENAYYDTITAHTKQFQKDLFEEMKARIKEDDASVPYKKNGYYYITRFVIGGQYPIYSRKEKSLDAEEEIMFNVNDLAKEHDYFNLVGLNVSPNNSLAAFAVDTVSRRQYNLQIKDLKTGNITEKNIDGVFIFIGYLPNTETIKDFIKLSDRQEILVDADMKTNIPGIFAAGDCISKKYRQVTTAVAEGTIAALSAAEYLR